MTFRKKSIKVLRQLAGKDLPNLVVDGEKR